MYLKLFLCADVKCEPTECNSRSQKRANSQMSPSAISDINANSNKHVDSCGAQLVPAASRLKVACPLCESQVAAERAEMEEHLMKVYIYIYTK